jgi:NAD(P)-dependent dehydrogenase (short-subunit alcohol dehydrogenase family)
MSLRREIGPIFITGAGSGIGRALTERLAAMNRRVYATARRPSDLSSLGLIRNVIPIDLDVRRPEQVEAAVDTVRSAGGLEVLVNNAGVGGIGPLCSFTDEEILDLFDVNVFGVVRLSRAFMPLLLESKGRVVTIGSQGGTISSKYYGPYTMTKHALEAFTVALDAEIRPFGARAVIVQPGGVRTDIGAKSDRETRARFERATPPFDREAAQVLSTFDEPDGFDDRLPESSTNRNPSPPESVVDVVMEALAAEEPRLRYLVGTRWEGDRVVDALLDRLVDANECATLRYSLADLVERLEARMEPGGRPR